MQSCILSFQKQGKCCSAIFPINIYFFRAHLRAVDSSTLGPPAEDLALAARTELAAGAVPQVSMVTHRVLVQAAPFGRSAFVTALTGALYCGLTLQGWNRDFQV